MVFDDRCDDTVHLERKDGVIITSLNYLYYLVKLLLCVKCMIEYSYVLMCLGKTKVIEIVISLLELYIPLNLF